MSRFGRNSVSIHTEERGTLEIHCLICAATSSTPVSCS